MEHNYLNLEANPKIAHQTIHQRDNNLDHIDNLHELPNTPAVFAVCGRVNGKAVNPRYVGETDDLQHAIILLFHKSEPAPDGNTCFKEFMMSIKTKELVYELFPGSDVQSRKVTKAEWEKRFQPKCNEELNEIH